jgi:uncharacterized repeat protein (TIGR03803 family)
MSSSKLLLVSMVGAIGVCFVACGANNTPPPSPSSITGISASCILTTVPVSSTTQCSATVAGTGSYSTAASWSVNGTRGGDSTVGTISTTGMYTAPPSVPNPASVEISATSVADSSKSGNTNITIVATTTSLAVSIIDLPANTLGNVTVLKPDGETITLTSSQIIDGPTGEYVVKALGVAVGSNVYYATIPAQNITVSSGAADHVTVDYYNIVPNTTKGLDASGQASLTVSADGTTLTLSDTSAVAKSLQPGDVLAVPACTAAPLGLLRKVKSVASSGDEITLTVVPATLSDAFQRASIQIGPTPLSSDNIRSIHLPPGISFHAGQILSRTRRRPSEKQSSQSVADPCSGFSIGVFDISKPIGTQVVPGINVDGQIEICSGFNFQVNIGWVGFRPTLQSLTATSTFGQYSDLNIEGRFLDGSFQKDYDFPVITFAPIPFLVGGIYVEVTPNLTVVYGASGNVSAGFSTGVTEAASVTGGLAYSAGNWSPVFTPSLMFAYDPIAIDAGLSAKAYAGGQISLDVYDLIGPYFKLDGYLQLNADIANDPWWTLTGGLEGPAGVHVEFLGVDLADYEFGSLFDKSSVLLSATGAFTTSAAAPVLSVVSPNTALAGSTTQLVTLGGTNFVPGSAASFNGFPLSTAFGTPTGLTATIPASYLTTVGVFPITVTNPDTPGAISLPTNYAVTAVGPTLTSIVVTAPQPSVVVGATDQFTATGIYSDSSKQNLTGSVTWASSNASAATITTNGATPGLAQGIAPGTTNITASFASMSSPAVPLTVTTAPPITVTVSPTVAQLLTNSTQQFAATVTGTTNGTVSWAVEEGTSGGTVNPSGLYTAPSSAGTFHVVATSQADSTKTAMATVYVSAGSQPTEKVLFNFTGGADGQSPASGLILDSSGNLYGTTQRGGEYGYGTVFEVTPSNGTWTEKVLYAFQGGSDGEYPDAGVVFDSSGNLYGTTEYGGTGYGTVFQLKPSGSGWAETILHSFVGSDGQYPTSSLVFDSTGNLYGTTLFGGDSICQVQGCGTVFKLAPSGDGAYALSTLYSGQQEQEPTGVALDSAGNLYGVSVYGGIFEGSYFEVAADGTFTDLHDFGQLDEQDGQHPTGSPVIDQAGVIYIVSSGGGFFHDVTGAEDGGYGTVWTPTDGSYSAFHTFTSADCEQPGDCDISAPPGVPDGAKPLSNITQDMQGNFYGTTSSGGIGALSLQGSGYGIVYEIQSDGTYSIIYEFCQQTNCTDGANPPGPLVLDSGGNIYGVTSFGGSTNNGVVFQIAPPTVSDSERSKNKASVRKLRMHP